MTLRTAQDLSNHPCLYKLKGFEKSLVPDPAAAPQPQQMIKVKRQIPKLDANGKIIYKTVIMPVKKGCGCKGQAQTIENKEQQVPEMVEVEVMVPANTIPAKAAGIPTEGSFVICKLYGTVKSSLCENCRTYKSNK